MSGCVFRRILLVCQWISPARTICVQTLKGIYHMLYVYHVQQAGCGIPPSIPSNFRRVCVTEASSLYQLTMAEVPYSAHCLEHTLRHQTMRGSGQQVNSASRSRPSWCAKPFPKTRRPFSLSDISSALSRPTAVSNWQTFRTLLQGPTSRELCASMIATGSRFRKYSTTRSAAHPGLS